MTNHRVRISSAVDHDARHYTFSRNSGLPHGYFDNDRAGGLAVLLVCALAVVLIALGVIA